MGWGGGWDLTQDQNPNKPRWLFAKARHSAASVQGGNVVTHQILRQQGHWQEHEQTQEQGLLVPEERG